MKRRYLIASISIMFLFIPRPATALDPKVRITQYRHDAWRVQDGAFDSAPSVVTQTRDGYIWIGAGSRLVKYDGVRFSPWTPVAGASVSISTVTALKSSRDGTLWIGTTTGLLSLKNNILQANIIGRINSILEDRKGQTWATRSRVPGGGLCEIVGEHPGCNGGGPMMLPYAGPFTEDALGNLWIGAPNQLMRWNDGVSETYFTKELQPFQGLNSVNSIATGSDGSVWASVPGKGLGLFHIVNGTARKAAFEGIDTQKIMALFVDRDGSLWIGTSNDGVFRVYGERIDHFGAGNGLSSNFVNGFYQDREGNLWLTTSRGLDSFRDVLVTTFSTSEGLSADLAASVLALANGDVLIGNKGSLDVLHGGKLSSTKIPGTRVTALLQDHAKRVWAGVDNLVTVYEHGQFKKISRPDGSPIGTAVSIVEDAEQTVWVSLAGPAPKLVRIRDAGRLDEAPMPPGTRATFLAADPARGIWLGLSDGNLGHYRGDKLEIFQIPKPPRNNLLASGLGLQTISGLSIDADGSAWLATRIGMVRLKNRELKTLSSKNGLPCDDMASSIRDNHANLWIYARCGLISIPDSELQQWWQHPERPVGFRVFDVFDGAMPGLSTFRPSVSRSPDGRLWFATDTVIQTIDPASLGKNMTPSPVYIEGVSAGRKPFPLDGRVRLPPHSRDIVIDYTSPSFATPQKVHFRYKLDGRNQEWHDAGTRRQAFLGELPPGPYRFHVTASNNDGVTNQEEAKLDFLVEPAYYQTLWFQIGCVAISLVSLWGLHRRRMRQVAHQFNVRLEERIGERTRIARELHDTILQSFQGSLFEFQAARNLLPARIDDAIHTLDGAIGSAEAAIAEGRDAIHDLRAGSSAGSDLANLLTAAGKELSEAQHSNGTSAAFRLTVEGPSQSLSPLLQDEVYRIGREVLGNAFRHARARNVEVELRYDNRVLRLRIRDDGIGIDPKVLSQGERPGHWGLPGVRERAKLIGAKLDFWSEAGAGTEVQLAVPASVAYAKSPEARALRMVGRTKRSHAD